MVAWLHTRTVLLLLIVSIPIFISRFQARASQQDWGVVITRILRDLKMRNPVWAPLSDWVSAQTKNASVLFFIVGLFS